MRVLQIFAVWTAAFAGFCNAQVGPVEPQRFFESVLPALAYGPSCFSQIELRNLSDRAVTVDLEGHRASGALVGFAGLPGTAIRLAPHGRGTYRLEIPEETTAAWVKVRERGPPDAPPAVSVSAQSECIEGDRLRSVRRDVAFPLRSPWFDSDVSAIRGGLVSLINTTASGALARLCYSSGNLFSVPGGGRAGDLAPICSLAFDLLIPPFGAREFPVERDGSSHFTMRTAGAAIVLEMLRPLEASTKIYRVDSSIRFDGESDRR